MDLDLVVFCYIPKDGRKKVLAVFAESPEGHFEKEFSATQISAG